MYAPRKVRFLVSCCAFALAGLADEASATQVWRVGAGSDCEAHSIQEAVDLAEASGTDDDKVISLSTDLDYSAQAVEMENLDVGIEGGNTSCSSLFHGDPPVISGAGAVGPVFNIEGTSHVTFSTLEIREGNASYGGGINFVGNGSLSLYHTVVDFNSATWGGGIDAVAANGTLDVYLGTETQILRNTASNGGGGIELAGSTAYLYAVQPDVLIAFNNAGSGNGGGIEATGDSTVTLGSPGFHGLPLVFLNTAQWGGGVAIEGDGSTHHAVWLRMFAMDPSAAVAVSGNIAYVAGGGIYVKPLTDFVMNAVMCAQDFQINGNVAPEGAAIYLGWDNVKTNDLGAEAFINRPNDDYDPPQPCDIESLGATHCAAGVPCNEISDNVTQDGTGNPTPGAVVLLGTSAEFYADRIAMHGNVAQNMFKALGNNDFGDLLELSNCLTGGNQFARELIYLENDDNPVTIDQCTFAPDIINSTHMIRFDNSGGNSLRLTNSIVDEPGTLTVYATGGMDVVADYVLTNDGTTLPSPPSVIVGTPDFVDLANGDYHLAPGSLGIDFAPAAGGVDLDGRTRDIDIPTRPNVFGPRDLGAYEVQLSCSRVDTIYCDGFEG
jgi:hypothetical protein